MDRSSLTFSLLVAAAFMDTSQAQATECFTMFDAKNALVYQSTTTPINLSGSISDQMTRFFPSRYLVISDVGTCAESGAGSGSAGSDGGSGGTNGPAVYGRTRRAVRRSALHQSTPSRCGDSAGRLQPRVAESRVV